MYDKVFVLDRGEVIESGNHRELSQKEGGFFAKSKNQNNKGGAEEKKSDD